MLEAPGHSRGHVAYWRESDRVLILGDVLNGMNVSTGIRGLHEPPDDLHARPGAQPASPRAGSPRWSRRSSASATARRCATRGELAEFIARMPD